MQSLLRSISSLRGATSNSCCLTSMRAFSETATEELSKNIDGVKTTLHRLLTTADKPLTSAEVWTLAEQEGLKSKRFMKQMLQQMKKRGHIKTVALGAGKKHKSFGYLLPEGSAASAALRENKQPNEA